MRPPAIRIYCGGYDYYCERLVAANPVVAVAENSKPKDSERKIQRRERAELVQERGRRRKELSTQLSVAEKLIDVLEAEEKELIAKLESGGASDYASINRRLYEIHIELPKAMHGWEIASTQLEKLTAEPLPD
ncbi:MAG: TolC family protein [Lentisphaerae bacterium]|nr:TolC family protein [Lentisphaerota bacterium]